MNLSPGSNQPPVLARVFASWLAAAVAEAFAAAVVAGVAAVALACACAFVALEAGSNWPGVWAAWLVASGAEPGVATAMARPTRGCESEKGRKMGAGELVAQGRV